MTNDLQTALKHIAEVLTEQLIVYANAESFTLAGIPAQLYDRILVVTQEARTYKDFYGNSDQVAHLEFTIQSIQPRRAS